MTLHSGSSLPRPGRWFARAAAWLWLWPALALVSGNLASAQGEFPAEGGRSTLAERPLPAPTTPARAPEDVSGSVSIAPEELADPVVSVRITGNKTIPNSEITKSIKTRPGRALSQKMIREDVDALVRTRWFTTVEPSVAMTDAGLEVVFRVVERPIVRRIEYRGSNKIKVDKLAAITALKVGSPYDVSANKECARRMEDHYHEKGFTFAKVELSSGTHPDDREVIFEIDEGPKVQVVAIHFNGNEAFSDAILALRLQTKKRIIPYFGGKYDPASIPNDITALQQYYHNLGYFDVQIEHRIGLSEDRAQVTIEYDIVEGVQYHIRQLEFVGNDVVPEETLRQKLTIASGEPFSARKLNQDVEQMRLIYGQQGRLFSKVDAVPRFLEEPGQVDLVFRIDEDKVYRVREFNVHIAGDHPHTRTNLIRNMSRINPGDLANPEQIRKTKRWLEGSGYFETGPDLGPRLEIARADEPDWIQPLVSGPALARSQSPYFSEPEEDFESERWGQFEPVSMQVARAPRETTPQSPLVPAGHTAPALAGTANAAQVSRPSTTPAARPTSRQNLNTPVGRARVTPSSPRTTGMQTSTNSPTTGASTADAIFAEPTSDASSPLDADLSPISIRGQSSDPLRPPANFGFDNSPQGDPFGEAIRNPDPNIWQQMPPPEFIDIDAYLTEARTGRIMFGVGVNSDAGVVGNIVLQENNFDIARFPTSFADIANGTAFRGAGQKFRIEATPGSEVSRYLVDWSDPYIFDTNYNLGVSGFYYTRFFRQWDEERLGGRVRIGRQFTPQWSASAALRLENVDLSTSQDPRADLLTESIGSNFLSTARFSVSHDTRDAAFNPGSGHMIEASVEQAFAEYTYTKLELEGSQYFTTYQRADGAGKHILMLRGQVGWTGDDTPIYERFFAGGFQTFRGFEFRGVTPIDTGTDIGGQFMTLGTVEYTVPLVANEMFKGVLFTDFGTVEDDLSLDNFRVAVGGGFRVSIPALGPVPLAFDFAVPVLSEDFDRDQLFSFYVGVTR